jgi:hypothetical protein
MTTKPLCFFDCVTLLYKNILFREQFFMYACFGIKDLYIFYLNVPCNFQNKQLVFLQRHVVAQLVEAVRYKLEGCCLDSRWCHQNFH